jgi:hypothetical protein
MKAKGNLSLIPNKVGNIKGNARKCHLWEKKCG